MAGARPLSDSPDPEDSLLKYNGAVQGKKESKPRSCFCKCCIITATIIAVLLFLTFITVFVGFPVAMRCSIELQRSFLFGPTDIEPEDITKIGQYVKGTRNLYVTLNKPENITLGVWHLLPEALINESIENETFNYTHSLVQPDYPVLLHFHGNGGNRLMFAPLLLNLRKFFHVISFDYRSYGDSTKAELTEEGIVEDSLVLYKWLLPQVAPNNLYLWGHSLGAALSTHTLAKLHNENLVPMGLILEAPFTTLREEIENFPTLSDIFSWLPWFSVTFQDGYENNGFYFKTTENILKVDCPIMILHAEDDFIIPYALGQKLSKIAQEKRNPVTQGNVTFHLFSAKFNYKHWGITRAPEMEIYLRNFIDICQEYTKTNNLTRKNEKY